MRRGQVYVWTPDPANQLGGRIAVSVESLPRLDTSGEGNRRLWGRFVRVRNAGRLNESNLATGEIRAVPIGDAQPNFDGEFLFDPGQGGGRVDKVPFVKPGRHRRYVQASHFGEVNTYYHLDRIANYVNDLLCELCAPPLPRVMAVVNAHHAATEINGERDGVKRGKRWLPFQGGHYRLAGRPFEVVEHEVVSADGEIHLGPGWQLLHHGALVEATGRSYRANASHNAGIIYHEFGHHITRHMADFRANELRRPERQNNRKTALDEAFCDYWAATMLGTPHIWAWHRRHDKQEVHPRSLTSAKMMKDYVTGPGADPHTNGTIWAAALWDLRTRMADTQRDGVRRTDLLVLKSLLEFGRLNDSDGQNTIKNVRLARASFSVGLSVILRADQLLHEGRHRQLILATFAARGIRPEPIHSASPRRLIVV